ncbi:Os03g0794100 [Oryza sativa Japonica Group]|jgi:hypothetical protein|uniref:Expressed protein n=3 Tax=Oryza sativa subsp. japonica TaxID=39947 RepID=Q852L6_ORYSJ|nr:hypothetical protein [Oryza sativa Japonica Group]ABF99318.1 expressed protein [Oryza sativa Japonica Group]BAS86816.1 Os03g0794100 [Oryza sativa Japonica Group]
MKIHIRSSSRLNSVHLKNQLGFGGNRQPNKYSNPIPSDRSSPWRWRWLCRSGSCWIDASTRSKREGEESEWEEVECTAWRASGCGDGDGDAAAEALARGLTLLVRLADPPAVSALAIRPADGVFLNAASVDVADGNLVILSAAFYGFPRRYYLIYDVAEASLAITPHLPRFCKPSFTLKPLPVRRRRRPRVGEAVVVDDGDDHRNYVLVLVAINFNKDDIICLWPPDPSWSSSSSLPWQRKETRFPVEMNRPWEQYGFSADSVFTLNGIAYWVDLALGVLYCKTSDLLLSDRDVVVEFSFIDLPPGYRADRNLFRPKMFRTLGYVGGSIKFVSVDGYHKREETYFNTEDEEEEEDGDDCIIEPVAAAERKITMWSLIPGGNLGWKKDAEFSVGDLWMWEEFQSIGLPRQQPINPILDPQEDGMLLLLIGDYYNDENDVLRCRDQHMITVDMKNQSIVCSTLLPCWLHLMVPDLVSSDLPQYLKSLR